MYQPLLIACLICWALTLWAYLDACKRVDFWREESQKTDEELAKSRKALNVWKQISKRRFDRRRKLSDRMKEIRELVEKEL